jgi:hypothetical protein
VEIRDDRDVHDASLATGPARCSCLMLRWK